MEEDKPDNHAAEGFLLLLGLLLLLVVASRESKRGRFLQLVLRMNPYLYSL